jgi:hypothetical protein
MKSYTFSFGSGNPSTYTGLAPTFLTFNNISDGSSLARPGITEIFTGSGVYRFQYEPQADTPVFFLLDGGTTITSDADRYIKGNLDPIQQVDQVLGVTSASFGSTSTDPLNMYGLVKRIQEWLEGAETFYKATGVWDKYSRGSSTLLAEKTLTNSTTSTTKT